MNEQAKAALDRLYTCRKNAEFAAQNAPEGGSVPSFLEEKKREFTEAMDDDLNTADAIGVLFTLAKEINILSNDPSTGKATLSACLDLFNELCDVLGILYVGFESAHASLPFIFSAHGKLHVALSATQPHFTDHNVFNCNGVGCRSECQSLAVAASWGCNSQFPMTGIVGGG